MLKFCYRYIMKKIKELLCIFVFVISIFSCAKKEDALLYMSILKKYDLSSGKEIE